MAHRSWLSLSELGQLFGISARHCERALDHAGWLDRHGRPTPAAIEAGAASLQGPQCHPRGCRWNGEVCRDLLMNQGYRPVSRDQHVKQWVALLEAMNEGSTAINATADQMAEDLPAELVDDVNAQLSLRGCPYQARRRASAC
jgi:hypothetical protein